MDAQSDLIHTLGNIGLSEKEAAVYLALLSLETATAYQIAEHCEVKKPTVYVILEDLRKKGLVLKVPHAKKALFVAQDIIEYLSAQESRLKAARAIVPKLHVLGSRPKESVYFFNGLRGMAQALEYKFKEMRGKSFHSFYGNLAGVSKDVVELYNRWDEKYIAADISSRIIMPEKNKEAQKELISLARERPDQVQIRFLEQYLYPSNMFFETGVDFLRIMDAKNVTATIIDGESAAEAMRQIFRIVWQKGEVSNTSPDT